MIKKGRFMLQRKTLPFQRECLSNLNMILYAATTLGLNLYPYTWFLPRGAGNCDGVRRKIYSPPFFHIGDVTTREHTARLVVLEAVSDSQ